MSTDFWAGVESITYAGRGLAEARMKTTWAIQYDTGETEVNDNDTEVQVFETGFTTKGRLKSTGLVVRETEAGGRTADEVTRELHLPVSTEDPFADARSQRGVFALCTAVHATDDPTMLGQRVRLSGPAPGSQTTARRLQVTEVVS